MTHIALDVEAVLANITEAVLHSTEKIDRDEWYKRAFGEKDYMMQVFMGASDAIWRHKPEIIQPVEPNLSEYVAELQKENRVDILTAREHVDESIVWWLNEHDISYDAYISTDKDKWKYTEYDVFVDDNPNMHGECRLLLRHQPWNKDIDANSSNSTDRIYSLGEVLDYV